MSFWLKDLTAYYCHKHSIAVINTLWWWWLNSRIQGFGNGYGSSLARLLLTAKSAFWHADPSALSTDDGPGWGWLGDCMLSLSASCVPSESGKLHAAPSRFTELRTGLSHWCALAVSGWSIRLPRLVLDSCLCNRTASSAGLWFLSVQPNCLFSWSVVPVCATQLPLQLVCGSCLGSPTASSAGLWFLSVQPNCLFSRSVVVVPVCATQLPLQPVCGSCLCSRTASSAGLWFLSVQPNCLFSRSVVPVCADELPLQPVCGSCLCNPTASASSAGLQNAVQEHHDRTFLLGTGRRALF